MNRHPSLETLRHWLDSHLNFEKLPQKDIFWLDTMEYLCQRFAQPQNAFPSVHLAGSKGKGSTSVMIASILEAAGLKAGLYTSPHILSFAERVGTASGPFPEDLYGAAATELMDGVESILPEELPGRRPVTWFELVTTFAFLCFRRAGVDWGIFETGLGGRLDATNVLEPRISVITAIELEHTEFLGDTIEKIASEKAGIIKGSTPVIIAPQEEAVLSVLQARAGELRSPVHKVKELVSVSGDMAGSRMTVELRSRLFGKPVSTTLQLLGEHQLWNAATAALAVKIMLPTIPEEAIARGLARARLPGRFEVVERDKQRIVLEGAHTPNSVALSLNTFKRFLEEADNLSTESPQKGHLLFACAADKDAKTMAGLFSGFDRITLTRPGQDKQSNPELLQEAFRQAGRPFTYHHDFHRAIENAVKEAGRQKAALLVTGSFYLVAEVKKWLLEDRF